MRNLNYAFVLLLLCFGAKAWSQPIAIQLNAPIEPSPFLVDYLEGWEEVSIEVDNRGGSIFRGKFFVYLEYNGSRVAESDTTTTPQDSFPPGGTRVLATGYEFYDEVGATILDDDMADGIRATGRLPAGTYRLCIQLVDAMGMGHPIVPVCWTFSIGEVFPPEIYYPAAGDVLPYEQVMVQAFPSSPADIQTTYQFEVYERLWDMTPEDAVLASLPIQTSLPLSVPNFLLNPASLPVATGDTLRLVIAVKALDVMGRVVGNPNQLAPVDISLVRPSLHWEGEGELPPATDPCDEQSAQDFIAGDSVMRIEPGERLSLGDEKNASEGATYLWFTEDKMQYREGPDVTFEAPPKSTFIYLLKENKCKELSLAAVRVQVKNPLRMTYKVDACGYLFVVPEEVAEEPEFSFGRALEIEGQEKEELEVRYPAFQDYKFEFVGKNLVPGPHPSAVRLDGEEAEWITVKVSNGSKIYEDSTLIQPPPNKYGEFSPLELPDSVVVGERLRVMAHGQEEGAWNAYNIREYEILVIDSKGDTTTVCPGCSETGFPNGSISVDLVDQQGQPLAAGDYTFRLSVTNCSCMEHWQPCSTQLDYFQRKNGQLVRADEHRFRIVEEGGKR